MSGRHAAPRRWFGRGRTRALLSLGVLVAGLGAVSTAAYWTDTAQVSPGTITSGSMDLQVGATTSGSFGAAGVGTGYSATHISISNLTPSERFAFPLAVRNVGTADFTYGATVRQGSPWSFVGTPIRVRVYAGAANTGDTTYPIQQSCGGTALTSEVTVTGTATPVIPAGRSLAKGTTDTQLCVLVSMDVDADNQNQGKQGQLRFDLTATQVTS